MAIIDLPRTQAASGSTEQQLKAISDQIRVFRDQVERQLIDLESGAGTADTAASSAALSQIVSDISDIQNDIETIQSDLPGKLEASDLSDIQTAIETIQSALPDKLEASDLSTIENSINAINTALGNKLDTTGDGKDVTVSATAAETKANLSTGEKLSVSVGKLMKWFTDFAAVAWSGSYNDLSDKPSPSSAGFLQEQIDDITTDIGDMNLNTTATDLTGAINETHDVPLDIQELYKPLIAPYSVSLSGFVAGSYLYYGIPWDSELRVFIKVSKSTAMSGTTAVGTLPTGYRPTEAQTLTAYDTDGNVISGITVTIGTNGAVAVVGSVDANTVIFASYKEA